MNLFPDKILQGEGDSRNWKNWVSLLQANTCLICVKKHGTILSFDTPTGSATPSPHHKCQCFIDPMRTKKAGTATADTLLGADAYLIKYGTLPPYYLTKAEAKEKGWKRWLGNLNDVLPGMMIGGDTFLNLLGKLPSAEGRTWKEADINYVSGYRNSSRILYSNDGLIFTTYDHYQTFYEITP